ncbi:MAG: hypothetical protein LBB67_03550, partial [Oscillospiraceae bacterium]|nr:hypothetical protein [Oscillospiraceae bacterium]
AAAGSYQWFESAFGNPVFSTRKARYKALDADAVLASAGSGGVLFLPYLSGERCPVNDPSAVGGFWGVTTQTTRSHMTRAVLEGVAFSLRQVYELIAAQTGDADQIVLAGGGSVSQLWRQIIADVFQLPVVTLEAGEEGSAFGAAILVALGTNSWRSPDEIAGKLRLSTQTAPNQTHAALYDEAFRRYARLHEAFASVRV